LTSPQVYHTLQAEVDGAALSTPVVRDEEARKLVYLQAVINEGLRMHPPSGGLLSKVTPPEGDTINGVFVPGGVNIATNTWGLMRSEDVFGPDVDYFRPERWLNISEAKYAGMARVVDLVFGSGRYKCLGRTIAWMELNKVFVEVKCVLFSTCFRLLISLSFSAILIGLWLIQQTRGRVQIWGSLCTEISMFGSQNE
jgi:cytochrome P450